MKKTLLAILVAVAMPAVATTETVKTIWPFGPVAATQPMRAIFEEANKSQKNYNFVLDFVSGGGGAPAVAAVSNSKDPAMLAHTSSSFILNPLMLDPAPYSVSDWQVLDTICSVPLVLASRKYKTLVDIPQDRPVSIGFTGVGSTAHLLAKVIATKYPRLVEVPYKASTQAVTDALGGHVDLVITLPGDSLAQHRAGELTIIGVSGKKRLENIPTLSSLGINKADDFTTTYFFAVPKAMDANKAKAWQTVLRNAKPAARQAMDNINCEPVDIPVNQLDARFDQLNKFWTNELKSIKK